jgi:hypothetical protein
MLFVIEELFFVFYFSLKIRPVLHFDWYQKKLIKGIFLFKMMKVNTVKDFSPYKFLFE